MKTKISENAKEVLRSAGWSDDYCAETDEVKKFLAEKGFSVPSVASDFFCDFYGIKVRLPYGLIIFEVYEQVAFLDDGDKPYLYALADAPLCPIGHGGGSWYFLTPSGEMIFLNDQWLGFCRYPDLYRGIDALFGIVRDPVLRDGVKLRDDQVPPEFRD